MPIGSAAPKSLPDYFKMVMNRLILPPPGIGVPFDSALHGEGIAYDGTDPAGRPSDNVFALALGSQWLSQWTGANAAVIVPSPGSPGQGPTGSDLKTLQSTRDRVALFALRWSVEIHVWGRESLTAVGREKDIERFREAYEIFENVSHVLHLAANGYGRWDGLAGFSTDTETMRYGESIVATFSVPVPVYDYPKTKINLPQILTPAPGHPVVESGVPK